MRDWYRSARPSIVAATASEIERNNAQDRQRGQTSLFGMLEEKAAPAPETTARLPEWPQSELLAAEKDLLGFYVTGHPLDAYADKIGEIAKARLGATAGGASSGGAGSWG
jgi:DNA polymerase-3 subunit alpha